jgi:hypothetical protein
MKKMLILSAAVLAVAVQAWALDFAPVVQIGASTNNLAVAVTNSQVLRGTVKAVHLSISGANALTCTVSLATVPTHTGIASQVLVPAIAITGDTVRYPVTSCVTNGAAIVTVDDFAEFVLMDDKLALTAYSAFTNETVNVRAVVVYERQFE